MTWNKASSGGWSMDTLAQGIYESADLGQIDDLRQADSWISLTMRIPASLHYLINPPTYLSEALQTLQRRSSSRLSYNIKSSGQNIILGAQHLLSALLHSSIYRYCYF
jgi:hypothetical protein